MAHTRSQQYCRILRLLLPHRGLLALGVAALAGASIVTLVLPQAVRQLIAEAEFSIESIDPWQTALLFTSLFALQAVCFYFRSYYFGLIGQRVSHRLRSEAFSRLLAQPIAFFDSQRSSDLVTRLSSDAMMLQDALSVRLSVLIRYGMQVIFGTIFMAVLSPQLTVCVSLIVPVLVILSMLLGRRLKLLSKQQQAALGVSATIAEEVVSSIRAVKAFGAELFESGRYAAANDGVRDAGCARVGVGSFFQSFVSFLLNVALVAVFLFGIHLVSSGTLPPADLAAFLMYGAIVGVSFGFLAGSVAEVYQALGASERVFELLALPIAADPSQRREFSADTQPCRIQFEAVHFAYPSRPDVMALNGVTFDIAAGSFTALVGPSGSGKSTIVSLLLGFYQPSRGRILLDGQATATLTDIAARGIVAYVPQEPALFSGTLLNNIRYGSSAAPLSEIHALCSELGLHEFIQALPLAYETEVGERGLQLSGGQRQRIAIARALLRKPSLLILDEATAALDSESEFHIQQALRSRMKGRTVVAIAHRLSTVREASQVLVLRQGKIAEAGTHDSLMQAGGLYRLLVEHQSL